MCRQGRLTLHRETQEAADGRDVDDPAAVPSWGDFLLHHLGDGVFHPQEGPTSIYGLEKG
jgi:hypothetical protein